MPPNLPEVVRDFMVLTTLDVYITHLSFGAQGKYAEAEAIFERLLTIQESTLGPDHPDVATSLHDMAGLLELQVRVGYIPIQLELAVSVCFVADRLPLFIARTPLLLRRATMMTPNHSLGGHRPYERRRWGRTTQKSLHRSTARQDCCRYR